MFKFSATLLVIYSILTITLSEAVLAQAQIPIKETAQTMGGSQGPAPDFRKIVGQSQRAYLDGTPSLDAKALGKINQTPPPKPGLSKKQKTWIVLGVIGFATLIFVLVKYGKNCLKTDPANCVLGSDEPCTCTEYEMKK